MSCQCDGSDFGSRANNRIIIQTPTEMSDTSGGRSITWPDTLTLWAIIEPRSGKETYIAGQLQSRVDAIITIRYQSTLADTKTAAKSRIKFGSRLYNINAVMNVADDMKTEGTAYHKLYCTENQPS